MRPILTSGKYLIALVLLHCVSIHAESFLAHQPGTAITTQTWAKVATVGHMSQRWGYEGAPYIDILDRIGFLGGFAEGDSEYNNGWNTYSYAENRWDNMSVIGRSTYFQDQGHSVDMWSYSTLDNNIITAGGNGGSNGWEHLYGNYTFDPVAITGHEHSSTTKSMPDGAGEIGQYSMVYDKLRNRHYLIPNGNNSVFSYDPVVNQWSLPTINAPIQQPSSSTAFAGVTYNENDHNIYMYAYDVPTNLSSGITAGATTMTVGQAFSIINNAFVVINTDGTNATEVVQVTAGGGVNGSSTLTIVRGQQGTTAVPHNISSLISVNVLYQLQPDTPSTGQFTWNPLKTQGGIPSNRNWSGFRFDSRDNIFLLVGGDIQPGDTGWNHDTWVLDPSTSPPTWTQLCTSCGPTPTILGDASLMHAGNVLSYWPTTNAFTYVAIGDGSTDFQTPGGGAISYTLAPASVWVYCYSACDNVGYLNSTLPSYTPVSGSQNRNTPSAASMPWIYATGSTLYTIWSESGPDFSASNFGLIHLYANSGAIGNLSAMGSSYASIDGGDNTDAEWAALTVANGVPWACFEINKVGVFPHGNCISWNGTVWNTGAINEANGNIGVNTNGLFQYRFAMTTIGTVPYVCFVESIFASANTDELRAYCRNFNGTSWNLVGTCTNQLLGSTATCTQPGFGSTFSKVGYISVTNDGTNPWLAWTERSETSPKTVNTRDSLYVSQFNGTSWVNKGGTINSVNSWAQIGSQSLTFTGGQPYVAYAERPDGSTVSASGCQNAAQCGVPQVFLKTWNGTSWNTLCGGSLNKNALNGWATNPIALADGSGNVFVIWEEQQGAYPLGAYGGQQTGEPTRIYAIKYNGSSCSNAGAALNVDSAYGSAQFTTCTALLAAPVCAWTEASITPTSISGQVSSSGATFGNLRQVYYKRFNGIDWLSPSCNITPASLPSGQVNQSYSQVLTANGCGAGTLTWTVSSGSLPPGLSGCSSVTGTTCTISGVPSTNAGSPYAFTIQVTDGVSNTATQAYSVTILPGAVAGGAFSGGVSSAPPPISH